MTAPRSLREALQDARQRPFRYLWDAAVFSLIIAGLYLACYVLAPAVSGR